MDKQNWIERIRAKLLELIAGKTAVFINVKLTACDIEAIDGTVIFIKSKLSISPDKKPSTKVKLTKDDN